VCDLFRQNNYANEGQENLLGQYYKSPKEVFFPNNGKSVFILELLINMVEYCKDHSGSRMVQKKYEEANEDEKGLMLETLLPFIYPLSKDVFGNYVIQKILDCTAHSNNPTIASQRLYFIMKRLEGYFYELSLHMYGCRVIQKALEVVDIENVLKIFNEVKFAILKFIEDQNGNHVIQKLIDRLEGRGMNLQIINVIKGRSYYFCTHQYGCRVIQKIFDNCKKEDFQPILDTILDNILSLSQDQYGNYVIQHMIENQDYSKMFKILNDLKGKIFDLCIHKYASNVIEKLLTHGSYKIRQIIIDEIISVDDKIK
jgi:pumilio RNA-binding family